MYAVTQSYLSVASTHARFAKITHNCRYNPGKRKKKEII